MSELQPVDREPTLRALVQMRTGTDVEVPTLRLLLPLTAYLVWAAVAIGWWLGGAELGPNDLTLLISGLGIVGLAASAGGSYVVFALLNRCNEHAGRTRALLRSALQALEPRAKASGQNALLSLNSAEDELYKLTQADRDRSALLWALLSLIPFLGSIFLVISLWRLSRDFARHGQLEDLVLQDFDRTVQMVGLTGITVRSAPVSKRDVLGVIIVACGLVEAFSAFLLGPEASLVLIYLTLGAISLLWLDLSIRDPIGHFAYHSQMEAALLKTLPEANGGVTG